MKKATVESNKKFENRNLKETRKFQTFFRDVTSSRQDTL